MRNWLKLLFLIPLFSCKGDPEPLRALYHWKTHFHYRDFDRGFADNIGLQRLYLRFFDVDMKDGKALPMATIRFHENIPAEIDIVPVVYITNRCLLDLKQEKTIELAGEISEKILRLSAKLPNKINELQIDCDWTQRSRSNYFLLLQEIKAMFPDVKLSCTIRLHQAKYRTESGIPPVHKGMLMFYNMGKIQDTSTFNSILDLSTAEKYLANLEEYPLDLDLAIPIFSWALWFRNGKPYRILNPINKTELDSCSILHQDGNRYRCTQSGIFRNDYIQENDLIRFEEVDPGLSLPATKLVSSSLKRTPAYISIYHWDSSLLSKYGKENIEVLYHAVH